MILGLLAVLGLSLSQQSVAGLEKTAVRIGDDIKPPTKIRDVSPKYPKDAMRGGLEGLVVLECIIDAKGRVVQSRTLKGIPPLSDAAAEAVKKWRYAPTMLNGAPVPIVMTVTVSFILTPPVYFEGLLDSLKSDNEFIRESAATLLGRGGSLPPGFSPDDKSHVVRELRRLFEHDTSKRVRDAAAQALARIIHEDCTGVDSVTTTGAVR